MEPINENPNFDPRTLPSTEEIDNFIQELSTVNLERVAFNTLFARMSSFLKPFPVFKVTMKQDTKVERARRHKLKGSPYACEKDITCREDDWNIFTFGRANTPLQSTFYGAIETKETKLARVTLLHEIHPDFRKRSVKLSEPSYMTIGQWISTKPLHLATIIFDYDARMNSEWIRELYEHHQNTVKPQLGARYEDIMKVMRFISNQFAKSVEGDSSGYMICAAYYNFVLANSNGQIQGIVYPSVQTNYQGANIAIHQSYVRASLKLQMAIEIEISQTGEKEFLVDIPRLCKDFGPLNSDFKWLAASYSEGNAGVVQFSSSS